jgi:predicted transposase/invertase (TIGR01784 family)
MSEFERIDYEDHLKFNRVRNNEIDSAMWKGEQKGKAEGRAEGKAEGRAEGRVEGRTEGRAEGRVEGKAEGKAEVAQNLKKIGMPADQISAATGLSIEEIENI